MKQKNISSNIFNREVQAALSILHSTGGCASSTFFVTSLRLRCTSLFESLCPWVCTKLDLRVENPFAANLVEIVFSPNYQDVESVGKTTNEFSLSRHLSSLVDAG